MLVQESVNQRHLTETSLPPSIIQGKFRLLMIKINVVSHMFRIMLKRTGNPLRALQLLKQMLEKYRSVFGESLITKVAKVNKRYFWRLGAPGFPSEAWKIMHENEVERFFTLCPSTGLRTLIFAITKKCPMNCEHCFEWQNLNNKERLSAEDIIRLIREYQDYGTSQIMFSGGEPMLRINDIYRVLSNVNKSSDFWIITSGLGFNGKHAQKLKESGLTGVMVSLDHFDPKKHDEFRGYAGAFQLAIEAVSHARKAGLATSLSFCAVRESVNYDQIKKYMDLAKSMGVCFVQILDPRSSGRYADKNVELGKEEMEILERIYLEYNNSTKYRDYPIINYLGYHQRHVGCFGAGNRFFYIDTDGDAHICPYCVEKVGSTLQHSPANIIDMLSHKSCFVFEKNKAI